MEKLFKHPKLIVVIITLITLFFGIQLPRVQLDNNNIRFLPEKNPAKIISEYIDETFGGQILVLVGLERPYRTVFEKGFLERIKEFSQTVENVEYVKSVNSIMSTQYITGDSESIIVSDLVPEDFAGTNEEITELRRRIASWDLFRGSLVSDDSSATQILITLNVFVGDFTRPEVTRSINTIQKIAEEVFANEAEIYFTGQPIINDEINKSIITDILFLVPLVIIVLPLMLFLSFRRSIFVALPLLTVIIAVLWTAGIAAIFGIKLSIIVAILPVILIAIGSADGIHIVAHYIQETRHKTLTLDEHRNFVFELVRSLLKPMFLTSITTFAGFISFCFTPIIPMREFGYCAGIGVITAFIVTITFIPSVLLIYVPLPPKETKKEKGGNGGFSDAVARVFSRIAQKRVLVLSCVLLVIGISIYGLSKVIIDNSIVEFFLDKTDISRSDRFIREYFGGSKDLALVIQADTTEEILHPGVLGPVDALSAYLTEYVPEVGKSVGFTDIIKRINQVFNVDQDPDGLRPAGVQLPVSQSGADSFGFGFNSSDDFGAGFDDFGFGGFDFNNEPETAEPPQRETEIHDLAQYSVSDLVGFLDSAAGRSPHLSGNDLVQELKRLTNYEGMAYYEIPVDPKRYAKETPEELQRIIANYLVLLAGDDDSGYSNDPLEPTAIRTLIQLRTTGSKDSKVIIDRIKEYIAVNFPKNVEVIIGGSIIYEMAVTDLILNSQVISILVSVPMVFIIIAFSNKSFIAGIIGAVPLVLAIVCNFAVMGFIGIKLNLGTALISSLAVGIGIDYTIHFIEFFKRESQSGAPDFLYRTFVGCGKAIIVNALSVGAGFGVLAFSQFKIIAELGLLIALSMVITALVSLTVIPVLLMVIKPKFIYK